MSQRRSDLHILLYFSIYIFPRYLYWNRRDALKIYFAIDPMHYQCQNFLILSHFSESFDVPAMCIMNCKEYLAKYQKIKKIFQIM